MATVGSSNDIWKSATKLISDNFTEFIIMIVLFVVVSLVILFIFGAIEGQIIGRFIFGFGSSGINYTGLAIVEAIQAVVLAFVYLWFIGVFYRLAEAFMQKQKSVNYVALVGQGVHDALAHPNVLVAMAALGFVGGLIGAFLGGFGYLASFLTSIFLAGAIGIGLVAFIKQSAPWFNFWDTFSQINKASSNAGIVLYLTLLVELVPFLNLIEMVMIPFAVIILSQKK